MLKLPAGLAWWGERPEGDAWLARLPAIAERLADRWELRLEAPFPGSNVSLAIPGLLRDGSRAVLKVNFPVAHALAWGLGPHDVRPGDGRVRPPPCYGSLR